MLMITPEPSAVRDQAFDRLSAEFPTVPVRILLDVFLGFLERTSSVSRAVEAARERILDACLAA